MTLPFVLCMPPIASSSPTDNAEIEETFYTTDDAEIKEAFYAFLGDEIDDADAARAAASKKGFYRLTFFYHVPKYSMTFSDISSAKIVITRDRSWQNSIRFCKIL